MKKTVQIILLSSLIIVGCASTSRCSGQMSEEINQLDQERSTVQSISIYPINWLEQWEGDVLQLTVPIATTGHPLTLARFKTPEDYSYITLDDNIFPTDVYVAILPDSALPKVFLARSPQSGCPIEWRGEAKRFKTYCDGSEFQIDGSYISGPAPRNMDEFPTLIQEGMLWITNTVKLGSPVVSTGD